MAKRIKKVFAGYKDTFTIEKVSVGYDKLFKTFDKLAKEEVSTIWYPPYNIRKTTASDYVIDVELTGYNKADISAKIEGDALVITAPGTDLFVDPEGDDVYYHQGIWPGGELYAKFWIAEGLQLNEATYDDGIVSFKFTDAAIEKPAYIVPIGPFDDPEESKPFEPVFNSIGEPVGRKDVDTGEVTAYEPEARIPVAVIVNEDTKKEVTVEVVVLDPMPQIVELEVEQLSEEVDKKSTEPQATIVLTDATYEVIPDAVVTEVIKTEEGKSDIVVAVPVETHAELTDAGIDVNKVITDALAKSEVASPELPAPVEEPSSTVIEVPATGTGDLVSVVIPEVLPSVVEATVEDGQVVLTDVSENIPADATVIPVVSAPGQPDIAVAVTPETQVALDDLGVDVVTDVSAAIVEAKTEVVPAEVIAPPVFPDIVETPVVVNGENTEVPTVEVVLPDPLPQIVEVSLDKVAETVDPASETPQATITVEEAVHEVSDNVITEVIKTEEGKSDIVVAIPEEVHAELIDKGIDVVQAVTEAIAQSEIAAPEAPVVEPTPVVETPVQIASGEEIKVVAPEVIAQVVEATVEVVPTGFNSLGEPTGGETTVVLTDVSTNVPADAELVPVVTAKGEHDVMVVVTPETQAALDTAGIDVAVDVGAALVEAKTEVIVAEVIPTEVAPAPEAAVTETILNADNPDVPTVSVTMPDPMPQIVEVTVEPIPAAAALDPASTEPQVVVTVSDATYEVSDNVSTDVIKTPEGQSDVVVAVTEETKAALEAVGVDVMETVKAAVEEAAPAAPELPAPEPMVEAETITVAVNETDAPKLEVMTPEVIPQVVEAVVVESTEGTKVELVPVPENIPTDAELIPVVTMEGQPDVMVAVTPQTQVALDAAGIDVAVDVGKALVEGEVEVTKVEEAAPAVVTETIVNADNTEVPTVSVSLPDPLPQIVEIKVEEIPASVDAASTEPQVNVVVSDATYEVSDNVATEVVATPEGQSDVVVAVAEETKAALEAVGVDVVAAVEAAIEAAAPAAPSLPAEAPVETMTVAVNEPSTDVPKLEVTTPDVIPQVVEAVLTEPVTEGVPAIELVNVSENIPADTTLIPVVTQEGQPDVMVAVSPEVQATLEAANVDIAADVSKALVEGEVEVAKTEEVVTQ